MNKRRSDYEHKESESVVCQGCGDISLDGCGNRGGLCSFCDGIAKELDSNQTEDHSHQSAPRSVSPNS